jgi:hypothetical protein
VRRLGQNLFVVSGVASEAGEADPQPAARQECPRQTAERLLAAARAAGDRRREALALTDLGVVTLGEGDAGRAVALHEQALAIARDLSDRATEGEVRANLGSAALAAGQPGRAREHLEQAVASARAAGDGLAEKAALEGLGRVHAATHAPRKALACFEQALALAHEVSDCRHQAKLLWQIAIGHAELGRGEEAVARGQAAADLLRAMGNPEAAWLAEHLERYRRGGTAVPPSGTLLAVSADLLLGRPALPAPTVPSRSPGLLRTALSAARAMATFVGSGGKRVSPAVHRSRVRTCAACAHHTGLRCRVCGCFTNAKAWLPHEECPPGKWPAASPDGTGRQERSSPPPLTHHERGLSA